MPPGLLESQFETLEPPDAGENPVTVSIDASVDAIVDDIVRQLRLGALDGGASLGKRA
jgi:gluconokinase